MTNPLVSHVVGARPNFMKLAPVLQALQERQCCRQQVIHTGQHYDASMSDVFFEELGLPEPDVNLGVGSGHHAAQTAAIMVRFDEYLQDVAPRLVLVYGDVNSTIAAALVCSKRGVGLAHVEAGLRSFDRNMPEEINRVLTDQLADWLFTPSEDADRNLVREGIERSRIHLVGNVMIDTLKRLLPRARRGCPESRIGVEAGSYVLVTLHRPSNVDDDGRLVAIMEALQDTGTRIPVVFPIHPRTAAAVRRLDYDPAPVQLVEPLGYLDFLALQSRARAVITDSGGIQEETTVLGVPCLTLRDTTERPVTVSLGTNTLVGCDPARLKSAIDSVLAAEPGPVRMPPLWDGRAGERIAAILQPWLAEFV